MRCACFAIVLILACASAARPQPGGAAFVPAGVCYEPPADRELAAHELQVLHRAGFNSILLEGRAAEHAVALDPLARRASLRIFLAGGPDAALLRRVTVDGETPASPAGVRLAAWGAVAEGARGLAFCPLAGLVGAAGVLGAGATRLPSFSAAGDLAGVLSRNAGLFAALTPLDAAIEVASFPSPRAVRARLLEGPQALVAIVLNEADSTQTAVLTFPAGTPEAIWQNIETGANVNLVAGPDGPTLSHTFAPKDVLVLLISTRRR